MKSSPVAGLRRLALVAVAAGAAFAAPAAQADPLLCIQSIEPGICVNDPRDVIPTLIADPKPCLVDVGYCAPGARCTVNVGYCAPGGNCVVNVGYCDDTDLPVGL